MQSCEPRIKEEIMRESQQSPAMAHDLKAFIMDKMLYGLERFQVEKDMSQQSHFLDFFKRGSRAILTDKKKEVIPIFVEVDGLVQTEIFDQWSHQQRETSFAFCLGLRG
ncbi:hypothetical protein L6164_008185 [Bauhinia variegata]|uniref:Uncharacterized protein n=1 Tax=Bauhinia variegata TaxID=167791 RepID=A0ACB9PEU0_BAUVA|nr:hypothetical protein L6164_008185 [Bauhinia variegata]